MTDSRYAARDALAAVQIECERQEAKWGQQDHPFPVFLAILQGEIGEASQEWLQREFERPPQQLAHDDGAVLRAELVQVAAVALQMVEASYRGACR